MEAMVLFMGVFGVVGVSVGIKLSIWIQLGLVVLGIIYLNSDYVGGKELGALIDMCIVQAMFIGMVIGNFIYLIFFWDRNASGFSLQSVFSFFFTP